LAATVLLFGLGSASIVYAVLVPDQEKLERLVDAAALVGAAQLAQENRSINQGIADAKQVARDGGLNITTSEVIVGKWNEHTATFEPGIDAVNAIQVNADHYAFIPAFSQINVRYDVQPLQATSTATFGQESPRLVTPK